MFTVKQERDRFMGEKGVDLTQMNLHDLNWWEIHLAALSSTAKEMRRDMDYWKDSGLEQEIASEVIRGGLESMRIEINKRIIEIADEMHEVLKVINTSQVSGMSTIPPYRMHFVMERKEKINETVKCEACGRPMTVNK